MCGLLVHVCGLLVHVCGLLVHVCGLLVHVCGLLVHVCSLSIWLVLVDNALGSILKTIFLNSKYSLEMSLL